MKTLLATLAALLQIHCSFGAELPFEVYNPRDSKPRGAAGKLEPFIYPSVQKLLAQFIEPKEGAFIRHLDAKKTLLWRAESATIIDPELVAVAFTEGHVEVIGIYRRDEKLRRWVLDAEYYGVFSVRHFSDEPDKTEVLPGVDSIRAFIQADYSVIGGDPSKGALYRAQVSIFEEGAKLMIKRTVEGKSETAELVSKVDRPEAPITWKAYFKKSKTRVSYLVKTYHDNLAVLLGEVTREEKVGKKTFVVETAYPNIYEEDQ